MRSEYRVFSSIGLVGFYRYFSVMIVTCGEKGECAKVGCEALSRERAGIFWYTAVGLLILCLFAVYLLNRASALA